MKLRKPLYTGGCQCGSVRYAIYGEPADSSLCYCRMCQKAVGGPFAAFVTARTEDFVWTRGDPATFQSSNIAMRDFCPTCGTPLTFREHGDETIGLTMGSLDQWNQFGPNHQTGIESRPDWLPLIPGMPAETTESASETAMAGRIESYQHPDHDTPEGWTPAALRGSRVL